jgi:cysteinyl-tRNA synthetase
MSSHYLGPTFDIHGGGKDLLFPHHENERAQSIAAVGGDFARYWVHNGFVTVESEKMSKSLGNFLTIRDALELYHPEVLRLFLLSKHYRSPLDFSRDAVLDIQSGLMRIYRTLERLETVLGPVEEGQDLTFSGLLPDGADKSFLSSFIAMMDDDLNTAGALGLIFEKVKDMNRVLDALGDSPDPEHSARLQEDRHHLLEAGQVLGLLNEKPEGFFEDLASSALSIDADHVERLIQERTEARARKDWTAADAIRDRLHDLGVVLEDTPKGTKWRYDV